MRSKNNKNNLWNASFTFEANENACSLRCVCPLKIADTVQINIIGESYRLMRMYLVSH